MSKLLNKLLLLALVMSLAVVPARATTDTNESTEVVTINETQALDQPGIDEIVLEEVLEDGQEDIEDLQDVCRPCHAYESGLSTFDPIGCNCDPLTAREWANNLKGEPSYGAALRHLHDIEDAYCA